MPELTPEAVAWAAKAVGADAQSARTTSLSQSGRGGPWRLTFSQHGAGVSTVLKLGRVGDAAVRRGFATEAAALEAAGEHHLPAPRVLAVDLDGADAGAVALLTTALAGSSRISPTPSPARLRALGGLAAAIHTVQVRPSRELPLRTRPLTAADLGEAPAGSALATAQQLVAGEQAAAVVKAQSEDVAGQQPAAVTEAQSADVTRAPVQRTSAGLVHGDLWHGNTLWDGDSLTGVVDWDFAGVGPAGVDLGSQRCDAAVMYGAGAAEEVLAGWVEVAGPADDVAWWDVVAAAATPPEMRHWLPNFHAQGRHDLTLELVTRRRDEFLAAALARLR